MNLKSSSNVAYPVRVVALNFITVTKRCVIQSERTMVTFYQVKTEKGKGLRNSGIGGSRQ